MSQGDVAAAAGAKGGGKGKKNRREDPYAALRCANARCTGYVYVSAYACAQGHAVCSACVLAAAGACPACRQPLPRAVVLDVDPRVLQLMQPCMFRARGCHYYFPRDELLFHQVECRYFQKQCFSTKCNFLGDNKELEAHMESTHHERVVKGTEVEFFLKNLVSVSHDISFVHFLSCHFGTFWVKHLYSTTQKQLYGAVQYLGPKQEAEKLEYQFELRESDDKGYTGLKCVYTSEMNTHIKTFDTLFETQECFTVTLHFVQYFEKNGIIHVRARVQEAGKEENKL